METNKKKIAFFDRDGVINKKPPEHCYVLNVNGFEFNSDVFPLMHKYLQVGFEIIIITNQRGIARGLMTEEDFEDITATMLKGLLKEKIDILEVYHCPHDNNACECRKPKPGMLIAATEKYDIDLDSSVLISDSWVDAEMGMKFGVGKNYLVEVDKPLKVLSLNGKTEDEN
jgi:D-glycero-D-manno-heptose 1,7-bisphosphate phosphatase